jgi:CBS domain-containing protein
MNTPVTEVLEQQHGGLARVAPGDMVSEAVRVMNARHIGSVLVMEGDQLAGILTERDVLGRIVGDGRDPDATRVSQVMTRRPQTIAPETTVVEAMVIVTRQHCRHLPVVREKEVLGMVSAGDLMRWVVDHNRAGIEDLASSIGATPPPPDDAWTGG